MGYKLREIAAERKFSQELKFEVLEQVLPLRTDQSGVGTAKTDLSSVSAN